MKVKVIKTDSYTKLSVFGSISHENTQKLSSQLETIADGSGKVAVIDFAGTNMIDSSGLGMLIYNQKRLKELGGEIIFMGIQGYVRQIVEDAALNKIFRVIENEGEI
ncbi:MAG: STAS domain-containing protein [bacterium]